MYDYCITATTADALKSLAVLHHINTCVNITLYFYTFRYKALQIYLRCLIHAHFINWQWKHMYRLFIDLKKSIVSFLYIVKRLLSGNVLIICIVFVNYRKNLQRI